MRIQVLSEPVPLSVRCPTNSVLTCRVRCAVLRSEPLQVLEYHPGGHYHTHHDSPMPPRYLTFLYYLTDVQAGGETSFPLADMDFEHWEEGHPKGWRTIRRGPEDKWNLSYVHNCHRSVFVPPKKGRALLFYSHLDAWCWEGQQWGCKLGELDRYALHGGCDVLKGVKFAANNWINVEDDPKTAGLKRSKRAKELVPDTIVLPHLQHLEL